MTDRERKARFAAYEYSKNTLPPWDACDLMVDEFMRGNASELAADMLDTFGPEVPAEIIDGLKAV